MNRHDQLALHQSQFAAVPYYSCISGTVFWKDFVCRVITITLGQLMKFSTYNRINIKISRYYYIQYKSLRDSLSVKEKKVIIWSSKKVLWPCKVEWSWLIFGSFLKQVYYWSFKFLLQVDLKKIIICRQCKFKVLHLMNIFLELRKDVFYSGRVYTELMEFIYDCNLL